MKKELKALIRATKKFVSHNAAALAAWSCILGTWMLMTTSVVRLIWTLADKANENALNTAGYMYGDVYIKALFFIALFVFIMLVVLIAFIEAVAEGNEKGRS